MTGPAWRDAEVHRTRAGTVLRIGDEVCIDDRSRMPLGRVTSFAPNACVWVLVRKRGGGVEQRCVTCARLDLLDQPTLFDVE